MSAVLDPFGSNILSSCVIFFKGWNCSLPSCFKMKLRILKGSRICLPNVPLWQNNYFELKATKLKAVENRYRKSFLPFLNLPKTDVSNHVPKLRFNCLLLRSQHLRDKCWSEREVCFIQEPGNLGRSWTCVQKPIPKILRKEENLKAKEKRSDITIWMQSSKE